MKPIFFALWAALIPGSFLALGRIPYPCSLASSLVLVALAWWQTREIQEAERLRFARGLALGMTFGFLGDLTMATGVLIGAMVVFGIGHGFYIRAMLRLARVEAGVPAWRLAASLIACVGTGLGIWYVLVRNGTGRAAGFPAFVYGGLAYSMVLSAMSGVATSLAGSGLRYATLGLGGLLFLASDAVIAARIFSPEVFTRIPDVVRADLVWLTYAPAQLFIVASGGAYRSALRRVA